MKIRDITLKDIRDGKNWRLVPETNDWFELPLEEWGPIGEASDFSPTDQIVYSGITVYEDGNVRAIVCVREVQYLDYGGDYCEFVDGEWRQVGLVPNPNVPDSEEFIANPLESDPSFDSDWDYRGHHRENFRRHISKLVDDA